MPDPEKIKEILDVVSEKVPGLLEKLSDILYGENQAEKYGKAVATFYNELKETGMDKEQIFELTREYMSTLNLGGMMVKWKKFGEHHEDWGKEIGKNIKDRIRRGKEEE